MVNDPPSTHWQPCIQSLSNTQLTCADNTISEVKFKTFGCGSAIASSSYLTELVKGMTLEQAGRIKNTEIAKELCLPPVKRECSPSAEIPKKEYIY